MEDQKLTGEGEWLGACGSSACIEVRHAGLVVYLRSSTSPEHTLPVTRDEWEKFKERIHSGEIA